MRHESPYVSAEIAVESEEDFIFLGGLGTFGTYILIKAFEGWFAGSGSVLIEGSVVFLLIAELTLTGGLTPPTEPNVCVWCS